MQTRISLLHSTAIIVAAALLATVAPVLQSQSSKLPPSRSVGNRAAQAAKPDLCWGWFVLMSANTDTQLWFNPKGFFLRMGPGKLVRLGTYELNGSTVTLKGAPTGESSVLTIRGGIIYGASGEQLWQRFTNGSPASLKITEFSGEYMLPSNGTRWAFKPDGTFVQTGASDRVSPGRFNVFGDILILTYDKTGISIPYRIQSEQLINMNNPNLVWYRQAAPPAPPSPSPSTSHTIDPKIDVVTADIIPMVTDSGIVRVRNFFRKAKGKDKDNGVILDKTPTYTTSYNAEIYYEKPDGSIGSRQGAFSIDLSDKGWTPADRLRAEQFLLTLLGVTKADFCKLPISDVFLESSVENTHGSLPPSFCPGGQP